MDKIETIIFPSPLGVLKCFSFHHILGPEYKYSDKEKLNLDEVMVAVNNSIFPNGIRPSSGQFLVMFHYPFQLIRSIYTTFYNWPSREDSPPTYHSMQFYIKAVEKLRRRKDGNEQCYDWKQFDSETMEDVMLDVGCRPPYWTSRYNHPLCNSSVQMENIVLHNSAKLFQDDKFQKTIPPCVEMKKIDVEFEEYSGDESKNDFSNDFYDHCADIAGGKDNWFIIHVNFWASIDFKEIKQIRAYSIMSAIGNASGYIGFLVGCSISELPTLIFWLCAKTKQFVIYLTSRKEEYSTEVVDEYDTSDNDEEEEHEKMENMAGGGNQVTFYFREYINGVETRMNETVCNLQQDVQQQFDKKTRILAQQLRRKVSTNDQNE